MSRDVVTVTRDDIHKAENQIVDADFSISFGLDGQWYDIDLTEEHRKELREQIERFIAFARKIDHGHPEWPARQDLAKLEAAEREKQLRLAIYDWAAGLDDDELPAMLPKNRGGYIKKPLQERYKEWHRRLGEG